MRDALVLELPMLALLVLVLECFANLCFVRGSVPVNALARVERVDCEDCECASVSLRWIHVRTWGELELESVYGLGTRSHGEWECCSVVD